jgi:hypothetical protein
MGATALGGFPDLKQVAWGWGANAEDLRPNKLVPIIRARSLMERLSHPSESIDGTAPRAELC